MKQVDILISKPGTANIIPCIIIIYTIVTLFFMSKIIHVYLFRDILFLFISIFTKIFEHKIFFSFVNEAVYSEVPFA